MAFSETRVRALKLSERQINDFERDGFLILNDVLSESDRAPIYAEYEALVDQIARDRNHIHSEWHTLTFEQRFTHLIATDPAAYEFLDISLPLSNALTQASGMHTGPAVFNLITHPNLLDIAESIVGPDVVSNPVQHVRIKPPENALNDQGRGNSNMARTGWHQDAAVLLEHAEQSPILTVWVAMSDATSEMGCMHAVPGSHRWPQLGQHCPGKSGAGEIYIPKPLVEEYEVENLAVRAGGVVLLHKNTWHGAGPNQSDRLRWSFDLRYQPPSYATGRECFPEFYARSKHHPERVISHPSQWVKLWQTARENIGNGVTQAVFNERWEKFRNDPLCA